MLHEIVCSFIIGPYKVQSKLPISCADPESFVRGGPNLITIFFSSPEPLAQGELL